MSIKTSGIFMLLFFIAVGEMKAQTLDTFYHRKFGVFYSHQYADFRQGPNTVYNPAYRGVSNVSFDLVYPVITFSNSRKHGFFFKYENMFIGDVIPMIFRHRFRSTNFGFPDEGKGVFTNFIGQFDAAINVYVSKNKRFIFRSGVEVADYTSSTYDIMTGIFLNVDKMVTRQTMLRLNTSVSYDILNIYAIDRNFTSVSERPFCIIFQPEIIHKSGIFSGCDIRVYDGYARIGIKAGYRFAINPIKNSN